MALHAMKYVNNSLISHVVPAKSKGEITCLPFAYPVNCSRLEYIWCLSVGRLLAAYRPTSWALAADAEHLAAMHSME